ncbi:hypothetical protein V499_04706 [Pseudogymnoascus sp. VKM F-103]|nr:hypothetical protein V499_04706 [Pseudogymnoascus sp. VKM F-103]
MATITSITPFPFDVRTAFEAYISSPTYYNREQFSHEKWSQIHTILEDPAAFIPHNKESTNLKHHTLSSFKLVNNKLYKQSDRRSDKQHLRAVVQKAKVFDVIAQEHLKLLHAGRNKVWPTIKQKYYGIKREDVEFILKRFPIISGRAWERVQIDLIDMRHEPSGQYKWILHIKDHFSKYTQLYPLKSKHAEPIAECFAQFIAAFLPPKIMQADNGKEFKGALLLLLRKYGIQVVNGAPRSPQTQGLVEQANGVVENKLRAWKMDHGSTEWKDGLLEVTLAMNTQIHSTIGCAPAELLFRERSSYINWLDSQAQKDLTIGIEQEDPAMGPIFESDLQSELESETEALIDPQLQRVPEPSSSSEPERELDSRLRSQPRNRARATAQHQQAPKPRIEHSSSELNSEPSSSSELELERELNSELCRLVPTRAQARVLAQIQAEPEFCLELENSRAQRAPEPRIELSGLGLRTRTRAGARALIQLGPELGIELSSSRPNSEPSSGSELEPEPERELNSEPRRGTRARVPAQPRTELRATPDPIIERAIAATQRARISMVRKYTKKHDIQHFDIGAIVSIKVPREDRTSTDNKRLFARILEEPYPHRYRILTASGIIQRLIPTKSLGVVEQALWADIIIPTSTKQVSLGLAAREASTSARVRISCLTTRTEIALVERPRKRARADTVGNVAI